MGLTCKKCSPKNRCPHDDAIVYYAKNDTVFAKSCSNCGTLRGKYLRRNQDIVMVFDNTSWFVVNQEKYDKWD